MAVRKPNLSADRAAKLKKSSVRAGKAKGSVTARQKQNAGVKDGTIRLGRSGKSYNVYDAKSGSWLKGVVRSSDRPGPIAKKMGSEGPKTSSRPKPGPNKYVGETKHLSKWNMEKMLAKNRKNNVRYGK
jgi:hypothetical protein